MTTTSSDELNNMAAGPESRNAVTPPRETARYGGIDVFRHLLAVGVILLHLHSGARYSPALNHLMESIGSYCDGVVFGFFLIAGFFAKGQSTLSWSGTKSVFWKQFHRLLIPFFTFSLIYTFALVGLGKRTVASGLLATAVLHGASVQLYFLPFLFYVSIAFLFYTAVTSQYLKLSASMTLLLPFVGLLAFSEFHRTVESTGSDFLLLPLYATCYLAGHYLAIARKAKSLYFHVLCGALSLCFAIGSHWDPRLWKIAEIILLFWFFLSVSSLPFLHRRLPGSGGVYMLHAPLVIYGISSILAIAHVRDATNAALTLGLTYSICLVATLAFIRIFPKYAYLLLE